MPCPGRRSKDRSVRSRCRGARPRKAALKRLAGEHDPLFVTPLGNDKIIGGEGQDLLSGGAGKDVFVMLDTTDGTLEVDDILDFDILNDSINLADLLSGGFDPSDPGSEITFDQPGGTGTDLFIAVNGTDIATLGGVSFGDAPLKPFHLLTAVGIEKSHLAHFDPQASHLDVRKKIKAPLHHLHIGERGMNK